MRSVPERDVVVRRHPAGGWTWARAVGGAVRIYEGSWASAAAAQAALEACAERAMSGRLVVVCAWCPPAARVVLARPACAAAQDGLVSHGICPACKAKVLGELEQGRTLREIGPEAVARGGRS